MKILFVNQQPFDKPTGAERSSLNAAIGLSELGNEIEFLQCSDSNRQQILDIEGHSFISHSVESDCIHPELSLNTAAKHLKKWLNQHDTSKYDIIHSHNSAAHIAIDKARLDTSTVGTVRDYHWLCGGDAMCYTTQENLGYCDGLDCCNNLISQTWCSQKLSNHRFPFLPLQMGRTLYRMNLQTKISSSIINMDHIISISDFLKDIISSRLKIESGGITTVYNSVIESSYINNTLKEDIILYVGSLKPQKGILEAIRAFALVAETRSKSRFIVAGSGWLEDQAKELVKEHGLDQKVDFIGHVRKEKIIELYNRASVVVYPSIWPEPFGRISIEAMASGTPIVGSEFGAIPEVLNNWPASRIVNPKDHTTFAEAIIDLNDVDHSPKTMRIDEKYLHEQAASEHENIYDQIK